MGGPLDEKIFVQLHSRIWFRVGLNDQKCSADSKNICINVLYDIQCHYMTFFSNLSEGFSAKIGVFLKARDF